MTRTPSAFLSWFRRQFGTMPHARKSINDLRGDVSALDSRLWSARLALYEREVWEARYNAALKGWVAREGEKR